MGVDGSGSGGSGRGGSWSGGSGSGVDRSGGSSVTCCEQIIRLPRSLSAQQICSTTTSLQPFYFAHYKSYMYYAVYHKVHRAANAPVTGTSSLNPTTASCGMAHAPPTFPASSPRACVSRRPKLPSMGICSPRASTSPPSSPRVPTTAALPPPTILACSSSAKRSSVTPCRVRGRGLPCRDKV